MHKKHVLIIQHVPWEAPGRIMTVLDQAGVPVTIRHLADTQPKPLATVADLAGIVLMGGPMGARDIAQHPGLAAEEHLVQEAVEWEVPVLGVCLGHQIMAIALGGELLPASGPEFGIGTVQIVRDEVGFGPAGVDRPVLHWHNDVVTVPPGATLLATTETTPNQAFRYGSAVGMQFHLEVDEPLLTTWLDQPDMRTNLPPHAAHRLLNENRAADASINAFATSVFGEFAAAAQKRSQAT
jgi:GMP synthase (glutamine-hydrolysing)